MCVCATNNMWSEIYLTVFKQYKYEPRIVYVRLGSIQYSTIVVDLENTTCGLLIIQ